MSRLIQCNCKVRFVEALRGLGQFRQLVILKRLFVRATLIVILIWPTFIAVRPFLTLVFPLFYVISYIGRLAMLLNLLVIPTKYNLPGFMT